MNLDPITKDELNFIEQWYTPKALLEILFHDWDNLNAFDKEHFGELRLYQYSMLSDESLIDFELTGEQNKIGKKQLFQMKKNVADLYAFGARKFGKSLICMIMDMINTMMTSDGDKTAIASVDLIHIRQILDPVKNCLQVHPICKLFERRITGAPDFKIELKNDFVLNSVNFNIGSKNPGQQFYGKHVFRLWIEEACFSGRAVVAGVDESGKRQTYRLSELVNSDLWKSFKVYSYNFDTQLLELKNITKPFVKQVKDYTYYKVAIHANDSNKKRVLEASQKQQFFTASGYKYVNELIPGEKVYTFDYQNISSMQKEILIGTLLGDASFNSGRAKGGNANPSVSFCHGKGQAEYLKYKQDVFKNIFSYAYRRKTDITHDFKDTSYGGSVAKITSNSSPALIEFMEFKKNKTINMLLIEKYFSPISFAFWIMDDGSLGYAQGKTFFGAKYLHLNTQNFSVETCQNLVDFISFKYDIQGKVQIQTHWGNEYPIIVFDNDNTHKVVELVKQYVHPIFYYKLFHKSELCNFIYKGIDFSFQDLSVNVKDLLLETTIIEITPIKSKSWTMYDIEVEDNHNFFANGILVHNSLETEEVYDKRKDALSELGAIFRISGMTNFTPQSPAGKAYYGAETHKHVLNYPQFISPFWDLNEKNQRLEQYGGEGTIGYRMFVKGEIVEDGITTFDMQRVRAASIFENKEVKHIEITKDRFVHFKTFIIVERPGNCESLLVASDIGLHVTEINIFSKVNTKYEYLYNITLNNLTDDEQATIFKYIAAKTQANVVALDCGDGMGRAIYNELEKTISKDNLVWYDGSMKLAVGFELNDKGEVIFEKGIPIYKEEVMAEWSVKYLRDLLYQGNFIIPEDFKFISQISQVVGMTSGNRIIYKCTSTQGDHLFDSFRVAAIAIWIKGSTLTIPKIEMEWGIGANN